MDIRDIIATLRREKNLSEAQASKQAYTMVATIRGKHPRLKITAIVIDEQCMTVCLKNGVQVKFGPSFPVPVWKYHERARTMHPKRKTTSYFSTLAYIYSLQRRILFAKDEVTKVEVQAEIDAILKRCGAKSVEKLEERMETAAAAERGENVD